MPSGDSRKEFICAVASQFFGLSTTDEAIVSLHSVKDLNNFLDDGSAELLCAHYEGKKVSLSNKVCKFNFIHHHVNNVVHN